MSRQTCLRVRRGNVLRYRTTNIPFLFDKHRPITTKAWALRLRTRRWRQLTMHESFAVCSRMATTALAPAKVVRPLLVCRSGILMIVSSSRTLTSSVIHQKSCAVCRMKTCIPLIISKPSTEVSNILSLFSSSILCINSPILSCNADPIRQALREVVGSTIIVQLLE